MTTLRTFLSSRSFDWWIMTAFLIAYTAIYLPSVFAQIEAREFMSIDPASIMASLDGLTRPPYYNMNLQYHSQYYGWTYFSLNFFVLMAAKPFGLTSVLATNLIVRIVLFAIGAALVAGAYHLARRFFSTVWAVLIVAAVMVDPISAHYLVEIHPESLGLLLQIIAIKFLLDVYQGADFKRKSFFWAVTFLSLSALCKQSFFVANVSIYIGFFIAFATNSPVGKSLMTWRFFGDLTLRGTGRFLVVLALIHPYAILDMRSFIIAQKMLRSSAAVIDPATAAQAWFGQILENPIVLANFILLAAIPFLRKGLLPLRLSLGFTAVVNVILMVNQTNFILATYLYPTQAFMFFNVFYFAVHVAFHNLRHLVSTAIAQTVAAILGLGLILTLVTNLAFATYQVHSRYILDGLDTQRLAWAALRDLPLGTKIAYSPNVAVLSPLKETGCHAWQGCAGVPELTVFDPDYVVFSPDYVFFNAADYGKFVRDKGYVLERTITTSGPEMTAQCRANLGDSLINLPAFWVQNPVACVMAYDAALAARKAGTILGGNAIMIYKKPR